MLIYNIRIILIEIWSKNKYFDMSIYSLAQLEPGGVYYTVQCTQESDQSMICPSFLPCPYWPSWNVHYQNVNSWKKRSMNYFSYLATHLAGFYSTFIIVVHSNKMIPQCLLNKSKDFNICKNVNISLILLKWGHINRIGEWGKIQIVLICFKSSNSLLEIAGNFCFHE